MDATIYFDLSNKEAFETLNGGASFDFPRAYFGESLTVRGRFAQRIGGEQVEVSRVVREVRASIGHVDARPEAGFLSIKIGPLAVPSADGVNVTGALPAKATAAQVQAAINALALVGSGEDAIYGAASVVASHGSWLVTFEEATEPVEIHAASNSLFPVSFLRVRTQEVDGEIVHDLRLIQAPVAFTDHGERVVSPGPEVTRLQLGGENGEAKWPEIQRLFLPPGFRGLYQIRRGFLKSPLLKAGDDDADGADEIAAAIAPLADEGGGFDVTNPAQNTAHITATGSMVGEPLDLLEVEVFDAPEGDLAFTLDLKTAPLAVLLRERAEIALPIEIEADLEDENDPELVHTRKLYRGEITVARELHWEELSAVANIDWTRPPLPKDYVPFSPSQVSNGNLWWAEAVGDGVQSTIVIDHNLDTDLLAVFVYPNTSTGGPLSLGADFTYTRTNSNALEIAFAETPAAAEFVVVIFGLSQTSFFDPHGHTIPQIENLQEILDDLGGRLGALEIRSGGGSLPANVSGDTAEAARWKLPTLFEVYPSRQPIADPGASLADLDKSTLPRARGLFPAVHTDTVGAIPDSIGSPAPEDAGTVLRNESDGEILVPVGFGHSTARVKPGGLIATDGRTWFPVAQYGAEEPVAFVVDLGESNTALKAPGQALANGTRGRLSTTGELPAPLNASDDFFVVLSDPASGTLALSVEPGGEPIALSTVGTGSHAFTKRVETSFYPSQFERELFTIHVNDRQLRTGKALQLNFGLEAALYGANTSAQWSVLIEIGEAEGVTTPPITGVNLSRIKWRGTPILEQRLLISPVTALHRFGVNVDRYTVSGEDRFRVTPLLYGASAAMATPPLSANFSLRARLARFDTEDGQSNPTGFVALKGLTFDALGNDGKHGFAFIS